MMGNRCIRRNSHGTHAKEQQHPILAFQWLFFLLWILSTNTWAFVLTPCPTKTVGFCISMVQPTKGGPRRRAFAVPVLKAATKVEKESSLKSRSWYPENNFAEAIESRQDLERQSLELMAELLRPFLCREIDTVEDEDDIEILDKDLVERANSVAYQLAKERFVDLCGNREGEERLENFFLSAANTRIGNKVLQNDSNLAGYTKMVEGAIISLQSLLAYAMTYGLALNPTSVVRAVAHMKKEAESLDSTWTKAGETWTPTHTLRLKYMSLSDSDADEKVPGQQLLSTLKWKRTPLRTYELLVELGVWGKYENLTLLRSGHPLRFTASEEEAARRVARESEDPSSFDPDKVLGIRKDFRSQKVYTIDGASTKEIDDGLGVEILQGDNSGEHKYRYWIHIADADRWADRKSELFQAAKRRATSIYLPGKSIPMMPASVSQELMSLKAQTDVCALSLGVEVNDDGSVVEDSIIVTPSTVRVDYRLTYDDADEMLEDGVAYNEEWELGQLYTVAQRRREFRIRNGSAEGFVPKQIPQYSISTFPDMDAHDGIGIKVDVQVSHNGGKNQSSIVADPRSASLVDEMPVSSSSLLVTEMMILAGEAIGKWACREQTKSSKETDNTLELPFRSQENPDYRSRERERKIMLDLLENKIGDGYCHAWYARRFFSPAKVTPEANSHCGLGLDCYVHWSSPIRRFQDLQVHAVVKRFLRRQKVMELLKHGSSVPTEISAEDLGCKLPSQNDDGKLVLDLEEVDTDIDYSETVNLLKPAQLVMRNSNKFWMLEYIRRIKEEDAQRTFEVLVLGCINPAKRQYAVYIYEFGLEWRYSSPVGIQAGDRFKVRLGNVLPQNGQMTLVRVANGSVR